MNGPKMYLRCPPTSLVILISSRKKYTAFPIEWKMTTNTEKRKNPTMQYSQKRKEYSTDTTVLIRSN